MSNIPLCVCTAAAAAAKLLQLCPTLCDPIDGSPPGSPMPGILQARTLEWVAISFSNAWKWKVKVQSLSRVWLPATPWTAAYQAPPSMGFSRQEHWRGCHRLLRWGHLVSILFALLIKTRNSFNFPYYNFKSNAFLKIYITGNMYNTKIWTNKFIFNLQN